MSCILHVLVGQGNSLVFRVDQPCLLRVGRGVDCDIVLRDPAVSRQHCLFDCRRGSILARDTNSLNGLYLDGQRVQGSVEVGPGAHLRLGGTCLAVLEDPGISEEDYFRWYSAKKLLSFLPAQGSSRKLRLLACGWCQHLLADPGEEQFQRLIDLGRRLADGESIELDVEQEWDRVRAPYIVGLVLPEEVRLQTALNLCQEPGWNAAAGVLRYAGWSPDVSDPAEQARRMALDVLGDFFHPFSAKDEWLCWNDGTVSQLATMIYRTQDFSALPVLADALEDAGCTEEVVLRHCREEGPHIRGCWVVDGLLPQRNRPQATHPGPAKTSLR